VSCCNDRGGRTVIERVAYQVGLFHNGITSARELGSSWIRCIDRTGAVLFSFDDGGDFVNGYADVGMKCACADISFGAIDRTGKVVLPMLYSEVGSYSGGFFAIKAGGRAGHIDFRGKVLGRQH
jgi:hypothetical protein